MKKFFIAFSFVPLALFLTAGAAFADNTPETTAILEAESLSASDLGISEPTLLPTSPFYFFKAWRIGFQRFFTFNPVKKAELELKLADEKIAEAQKVAQTSPERSEAIEQALANYQTAQERLKAKLEALKETSQNPEVDKLLEKLADRAIKHEKIFAELAEKFAGQKDIKEKLEEVRGKIEDSLAAGGEKDTADRFSKKISKALEEIQGSDLKHMASLEVLDRFENKVGEKLKEQLGRVRQDIAEKFKEDLEEFAREHATTSPEILRDALEKLPGDKVRRLVILEEIRPKLEAVLREALQSAGNNLEEEFDRQIIAPGTSRACPGITKPEACRKDLSSDECVRQIKEISSKYPNCGFEKSLRAESRIENEVEEKLEDIKKEIERNPIINIGPRVNPKVEPVKIAPVAPALAEFKVEADDGGFYPTDVISVTKGSRVRLHLIVRTDKVYFGGLDFRSDKFKTESVRPGGETIAEFSADSPFVISSYWPLSGVKKAELRVEIK